MTYEQTPCVGRTQVDQGFREGVRDSIFSERCSFRYHIDLPSGADMQTTEYTMHAALPGVDYETALERVESALREEGFGILTRIDVRDTFRAKLDVEFKPYAILGACNPVLAHAALQQDDNVGVLLPCNVVVAATEDGAEVAIGRPDVMIAMAGNPGLKDVATDADARLSRVRQRLVSG